MSAVAIPLPTAVDPLAAAVHHYVDAKRAEDAAKKRRLEAEERILALQPAMEEGSVTLQAGDYKLTLTGKLTYECTSAAELAEACVAAGMPGSWVPVKTKVELDATGAKWLRANEPELWASVVSRFVSIKPAKTAVTVKV